MIHDDLARWSGICGSRAEFAVDELERARSDIARMRSWRRDDLLKHIDAALERLRPIAAADSLEKIQDELRRIEEQRARLGMARGR